MVILGLFPTLLVQYFSDRNIRCLFIEVQWLLQSQCDVKHRRWECFKHSHGLCAMFVLTPHCNPFWKQSHPPVCLSSEEKTADRDCHVLQSPSFRLLEPHWHLCWNLTGSSTWLVHVRLVENHSVCSVLSSLSIFVSLSLPAAIA